MKRKVNTYGHGIWLFTAKTHSDITAWPSSPAKSQRDNQRCWELCWVSFKFNIGVMSTPAELIADRRPAIVYMYACMEDGRAEGQEVVTTTVSSAMQTQKSVKFLFCLADCTDFTNENLKILFSQRYCLRVSNKQQHNLTVFKCIICRKHLLISNV